MEGGDGGAACGKKLKVKSMEEKGLGVNLCKTQANVRQDLN